MSGIDTLRAAPTRIHPRTKTAQAMAEFPTAWPYAEGRRKLIWEIASIPLYSFWQAYASACQQRNAKLLKARMHAAAGLNEVFHRFISFLSERLRDEIPVPHFYLGTNMSGDLKFRTPMAAGANRRRLSADVLCALSAAVHDRRRDEDDAGRSGLRQALSLAQDGLCGRYTPELAEAEYQRITRTFRRPGRHCWVIAAAFAGKISGVCNQTAALSVVVRDLTKIYPSKKGGASVVANDALSFEVHARRDVRAAGAERCG